MALFFRALGLSGYFPPPHGPFKDVSSTSFRFPNSVYTQIFYPALADVQGLPPKKAYMRPEAAHGFAKWMKLPRFAVHGIANSDHHLLLDAPPDIPTNKKSVQVMLFSHGLGGHAEAYSKFCGDVASHGYIVIALEHEDGSGSFAVDRKTNEHVFFKRPSDGMEYTRENVVQFRAPFLRHRHEETLEILRFIYKLGKDPTFLDEHNLTDNQKLLFKLMDTESVWLGGHSFGACTASFVAIEREMARERTEETEPIPEIAGIVLLDIWSFPLPEDHVSMGLAPPTLSILSEKFALNDEVSVTQTLLGNSKSTVSVYIPGITHPQFSDAPWWMPTWIARYVSAMGPMHRDESQDLIMDLVIKFMSDPTNTNIQFYTRSDEKVKSIT